MNRRVFLATAASGARVAGANDQVRGATIGTGGRGQLLTAEFKEIGVEMAAVCDVYEPNLQGGLKQASAGARPYDDYRRLLDDKSIDVVVIATPDHWHAQMTVDAVRAGKDVYVEKPMAHTIAEGFRMVEAVRKSDRIVQVGTQRRSSELFMECRSIIASGEPGEIKLVNSWWMNRWADSLRRPELEGKLDWQKWLGPAPKRELDLVRFHNWYWFYDYSGGMLVGQAAHIVDAINMLMNSTYPAAVACVAPRPNVEGAEIPETASLSIEYPENYLAVFTIGYRAMRYATYLDQMKQFHGSKARFDVGREFYALYPENPKAMELKPSKERKAPGSFVPATRSHIRNFLDCVRSRKEPTAPVEVGNYTNVVLCLAMDSLRSGRRLRWDAAGRRGI